MFKNILNFLKPKTISYDVKNGQAIPAATPPQPTGVPLSTRINSFVDKVVPPPPAIDRSQLVSPIPPTTPMPTPTKVPVPTPIPTDLEKKMMGTFDQYQLPKSAMFGIANAEGGNIGRNNIYNIGAFDSNPYLAHNFPSVEAAATAAAKLISKDPRYAEAYKLRNNPDAFVKAVQDAGYAGDPNTWVERSVSTGGAGLNFSSWSDFVKNTPAYRRWIKSDLGNR